MQWHSLVSHLISRTKRPLRDNWRFWLETTGVFLSLCFYNMAMTWFAVELVTEHRMTCNHVQTTLQATLTVLLA